MLGAKTTLLDAFKSANHVYDSWRMSPVLEHDGVVYLTGMTGLIYLAAAVSLGAVFIRHAVRLRRADAPADLPMRVFRYSINYLMLLFAALLVDHYLPLRP